MDVEIGFYSSVACSLRACSTIDESAGERLSRVAFSRIGFHESCQIGFNGVLLQESSNAHDTVSVGSGGSEVVEVLEACRRHIAAASCDGRHFCTIQNACIEWTMIFNIRSHGSKAEEGGGLNHVHMAFEDIGDTVF